MIPFINFSPSSYGDTEKQLSSLRAQLVALRDGVAEEVNRIDTDTNKRLEKIESDIARIDENVATIANALNMAISAAAETQ